MSSGCFIEKKGKLYPSLTGKYIYKISRSEYLVRVGQVAKFNQFFSVDWYNLLYNEIAGIDVSSWLGISTPDLRMINELRSDGQAAGFYYGIDLCGPNFRINDLNTDRATIVGFQPEIVGVFAKYFSTKHFNSFYDLFIPQLMKVAKEPAKVFVLIYPHEQYRIPIVSFAKKFGFQVGSIDTFKPAGVDIVVRQVKANEIINNEEKYKVLLNYLRKGGAMINPLGSYLAGHKGWSTILSAINYMPSDWFPKSWIVKQDWILSSEGEKQRFDLAVSRFRDFKSKNMRKNFVIKKGFGSGGGQVFIGSQMKRYQWEELLANIKLSNEVWVIEEKEPRNNLTISVGQRKDDSNEIDVMQERLNLIKRIYATTDSNQFSSEIFGKNSDKVNASGYTFPVEYEI